MRIQGYNCNLEAIAAGEDNLDLAILVHGFPDSPQNWTNIIDGLVKQGFRVIAPWLRGYSPSDVIPPFNIGTIGLDIVEIALKHSNNRKAIVVGHDFGAMGAYCAANMRPDLFSKIVTMSVPPFGAIFEGFLTVEQLKKSWYIFLNQTFLADIVLPMNEFELIDILWNDWGLSSTITYEPYSSIAKSCFSSPENIQAALEYYRSLFDLTIHEDKNITEAISAFQLPVGIPTLYLHGTNDGCIGSNVAAFAVKYLSSASTFKLIEGAGHFLQVDAPDKILDEMKNFLN